MRSIVKEQQVMKGRCKSLPITSLALLLIVFAALETANAGRLLPSATKKQKSLVSRSTTAQTSAPNKEGEIIDGFTVQVAATQSRTEAARMVDALVAKGYAAYFYKAAVKGKTYYRVRCGRFKTRTEAIAHSRLIARREGLKGFVARIEAGQASPVTDAGQSERGTEKKEKETDSPEPIPSVTDRWFLKDGDVVVFYGDSITEQRRYCQFVELGFRNAAKKQEWNPQVGFYAMGYSGMTAAWGLQNLNRVLALKPTVVTLMWGMNDANSQRQVQKSSLLDHFQSLSKQAMHLRKAGIRPVIMTVTPVDEKKDSNHTNSVLDAYASIQRRVALATGSSLVDVRKYFKSYLLKKGTRAWGELLMDGVHPTVAGHLLIAEAILDTWHIPH